MTDAELRDAAVVKLKAAFNDHWKLTTKGYKQMAQPLPATSQWAQGYEDYSAGLALLAQIGVEPEPPPASSATPPPISRLGTRHP